MCLRLCVRLFIFFGGGGGGGEKGFGGEEVDKGFRGVGRPCGLPLNKQQIKYLDDSLA